MNGNDLFTALSGLDPKYIDEAAFELKEKSAQAKQPKTVSFRKIMYIAVPSAAAILLILAVSFPAMHRVSKSESAASAPSEAPSFDAAAESPQAETEAADEAVAEAPQAEFAEEAEPQVETAGEEAADEEAPNYDAAKTETYNIKPERSDAAEAQPTAVYDNGILTIQTPGTVIYDMNSTYSIEAADGADAEILHEGILKDIAIGSDPLTLDISELALDKGNYTLKIGDETIDFTI